MEILRIEEYKKNRKLVYLEEGTPAFCLYTKEIRTFGLKEGAVLTDEQYQEIISVLCKRARERSLYLLEDMARTEQQVRRKLREGYYPEEAVDFAISYCKDKHYDYITAFCADKKLPLILSPAEDDRTNLSNQCKHKNDPVHKAVMLIIQSLCHIR